MAFSSAFSLLALYLSVSFLLPTSFSSCSLHTCQVNTLFLFDLCHSLWSNATLTTGSRSQLSDACSSSDDCAAGLYCGNCPAAGKKQTSCSRAQAIEPASIVSRFSFLFLNYNLLVLDWGGEWQDFSSGSCFSIKTGIICVLYYFILFSFICLNYDWLTTWMWKFLQLVKPL